jgi:Flp pilus assembly secretin CpaC
MQPAAAYLALSNGFPVGPIPPNFLPVAKAAPLAKGPAWPAKATAASLSVPASATSAPAGRDPFQRPHLAIKRTPPLAKLKTPAKITPHVASALQKTRPTVSRPSGIIARNLHPSQQSMAAALAGLADFDNKRPASIHPMASRFLPVGGGEKPVFKSGIQTQANEIDLTEGKAQVITLPSPAARVSISNPDVASAVIISPTQVQLIGKKVGVANLLVWDHLMAQQFRTFDITVHRDVSVLAKQLRLIDPGINIVPMAADDSVILTGEADSSEKSQFAVELAKAFFSSGGAGASPVSAGASGGAPASGGSGGGGGADLSSQAPGSAHPKPTPNVINLIRIKGQPTTKLELVRQRLKDIDQHIHLDIVPGPGGAEKAILTGRVATAGMVSKAVNVTSIFYGQPGLKVLTGPGGNLLRSAAGGPEFTKNDAYTSNMDINILQGSIVTDASGNVVSMLEVYQRPQIKCHIKFLDIARNDLNQLGATLTGLGRDLAFTNRSGAQSSARPITSIGNLFTTPSGTGFSNNATGANGLGPQTLNNFNVNNVSVLGELFGQGVTQVLTINQRATAAISAFIERRKIRSLAEPNLMLLSGEKGSFLAGGEIPIPVASQNGQVSVTFKEFGIRLNVTPTLKDDGRIHLQVAPEVSSVDPSISIPTGAGISVPGFSTRRMQTTLELTPGESFVMGGLFSQEDTEAWSKFPGLGDVPILGTMFRNQNADKRNKEMIVIIRPEVVMTPVAAAAAAP